MQLLLAVAALLALAAPASGCDEQVLAAVCRGQAPSACFICVGQHQHEARAAGCSAADVQRFCDEGGITVYASATAGSDANDGRSPATALRTLAAAVAATRRVKASQLLLQGKFFVNATLEQAHKQPAACDIWRDYLDRLFCDSRLNSQNVGLHIDKWPGSAQVTSEGPTLSGGQQLDAGQWFRTVGAPGLWKTRLTAAQG